MQGRGSPTACSLWLPPGNSYSIQQFKIVKRLFSPKYDILFIEVEFYFNKANELKLVSYHPKKFVAAFWVFFLCVCVVHKVSISI